MPAITPAELSKLQKNTKNIRNICILAHVDHGKTTLSDSLLATNGIISSKMAGKVRYLDSREDEQERGITMESSAISLYFKLVRTISNSEEPQQKTIESQYLINLIDSPGHVDFSTEVSTASRLCDGGLVLIDVVEGVCTQTISVLRQAWVDKVKPILVFNKMDRLIVELQMTPHEAYIHINKILEQVNAVMATFFTGDLMEDEARKLTAAAKERKEEEEDEVFDTNKVYDWSMEERDDSHIYFDPAKGNVIFASAVDGWAFRVQQFASIYAKKLGFKEQVLQKCLWGEYYFDPKNKRVIPPKLLKGRNLKPMFVQFVLENIWAVYGSVVVQPDRERVEKIVNALNIKVLPRDLRSRDPQILLSAIFSQWLPLSTCILLAIIGQLPPPIDAQAQRISKMLHPNVQQNDNEPIEPTNEVERALYACDASESAPAVAYVSKMFAVPVALLPENRRTQMTVEELRERGRQQRALRAARAQLEQSGEGIPLDQLNKLQLEEEEAELSHAEGEQEKDLTGERLIGFARLYSGTIRVGQKLYVMGPKYDPEHPNEHVSEITVKNLYLIMGRDLEALDQVSAGNVFGIGGLEGHILKNGTLASTLENVRNMAGVKMDTAPIVRVALEPEDPTEMDKLVEGLRLLNQADPCVEVLLQETGEHVILTAGELHLERCLRDLKERFAKIDIHVSDPIVPFRESIVRGELPINKEKEGIMVPRGLSEIKLSSKFLTLKIQAVPLPARVTEFLLKHTASIKVIVDEKLAKKSQKPDEMEDTMHHQQSEAPVSMNQLLSPKELENALREEFAQARKEGGPFAHYWEENIVDQIWAFGPRRVGSNMLINRIPGYVRKPFFQVDSNRNLEFYPEHADEVIKVTEEQQASELSILDIDFNIQTGFQLSTLAGPLCAEPMTGVCYIVQGVEFHPEEFFTQNGESVDVRSRLHIIQGQVIAAAKEAYRQGFLDWSPRLLLAMYACDIQASAEVLGRVYGVISKRKGKIVSEDLKEGTSFWHIKASLPVIESFGFSDEIRKRTSGAASPQLVFSGFDMLDEDPFWVPTTEEELEDLGEKADKENLAKKYMDTVRKRKGMFVEKKLVEHAEKQRTLKKN
ncbi:P-loop containing nucleoside triphosphate hydrolase protein [Mycotypha africana]|uniref:P-loop containing nucleoside triphosphate hydrolase protein n=1 Tax=Mycotypha africana TaxID=64632 RepID=UPI002300C7C5|nr:P-loop containing nucleoside triphosphate hydrolase protein [Mycotypha africana]KAI8979493.1 P-loop containing nucleoside triphosphate hydrolase protein [Mycotypha africana]